ncbi:MucR family transcriptional regulator [Sphingobium sp. V4]|uniref:MucR family transcriptional regulator n=1 Tax=Sphingobium sp. V4 TaxID=3038927 RepID=UPI002557FA4E|nr:MucR family transcriptional regulator [Sphingobium sp. V4]WIW89585.1 MucR family transcriptional regulator [Sphingobium sp. V4]
MSEAEKPDLTSLTVQLLSAYVSNNMVESSELAGLIQSTRAALSEEKAPDAPAAPEFVPATTARKSLASRDHIISMIDGKPYKTLKRHLSTNGLTPSEYRERYGLPRDYPMVAPGYSEQRREVAQRLGLGRKPAVAKQDGASEAMDAAPATSAEAPAPNNVAASIAAPAPSEAPAKPARKPRKTANAPVKKARTAKKSATSDPELATSEAVAADDVTVPEAAPVVAETPAKPARKAGNSASAAPKDAGPAKKSPDEGETRPARGRRSKPSEAASPVEAKTPRRRKAPAQPVVEAG